MIASTMLPYLILLLIPSLLALLNTRRLALIPWYCTFVFYVLFIGFRFEVGPDWIQYGYIHNNIYFLSLGEVLAQAEPLSHLLFWFSEKNGWHVYGTNLCAAIVMMAGVYSFARRTQNPWIALVAATPYFVVVMGMSGIRQSMAAGVILLLLAYWERLSFIRRGVFIMLAALFHTSALVNNIFLVAKLDIQLRYKILIGALILLVTFYLGTEVATYSENIMRYKERYLGEAFFEESFGSIYHIAMIAIPALIGFYLRKGLLQQVHNSALFYFGLYASFALLLINVYSPTVASRLTIYLYFVPMMIYPALIETLGRNSRLVIVLGVLALHLFLMLVWFFLGNHSYAYVPYRNILF